MVGRGVVPVQVGCGGAELAMFQLGRALGQAGHKVTMVADIVEGDFPTTELRVVPLDSRVRRREYRFTANVRGRGPGGG